MFRFGLSFNPRLQIICKGCKVLETRCMVRKGSLIQLPETEPSLLHDSFADLELCATRGCVTCRIIRKGLLRECYSTGQEDVLRGAKGAVNAIFPSISALGNRETPGLSFTVEIKVAESDPTPIFQTTIELAVSNDLISIARDARDPIVFQKAKQWMRGCLDDHFACSKAMDIGHPPYNPTRLLYIGDDATYPIRLITPNPAKLVPYCALSYCWGSEGNKLRTYKANIREHEKGIPLVRFSGTLLDFVMVSRKLNIKYIWIDALCIIQDDIDDWARESVMMYRVYGHALVTLSICSSKNSTEKFLKPRKAESLQLEHMIYAGSRLCLQPKTLENIRERSPLMERSWTFQEELLSPRVLYWTDHGIFWNCQLVQYAEHDAHAALRPRDRLTDWNRIVEAYSARLLTKANDRLTALAGVAAKFSKLHPGDEYLAGLWKSTLPQSLLWTVNGTPKDQGSPSSSAQEMHGASQYVAPSWSWASLVAGQVINTPAYLDSSNCQLKDYHISLQTNIRMDPLGPISDAMITLVGCVRQLVYPRSRLIKWPRSEQNEKKEEVYPSLWKPDYCTHALDEDKGRLMASPGRHNWVVVQLDSLVAYSPGDIECLQIGQGFLALTKIIPQGDSAKNSQLENVSKYRRVGAGFMSHCPEFFRTAGRREVTLI